MKLCGLGYEELHISWKDEKQWAVMSYVDCWGPIGIMMSI